MKSLSRAIKVAKRRGAHGAVVAAKIAAAASVGAILLSLLYLLLAPVVLTGVVAFKPRRLSLEDAKNYYALIAAGVGSFAGASGLFLGVFYYFNRLTWETRRARRERARARLHDLYKRIEDLDEIVCSMISSSIDHESTKRQAEKVVRALSSFEQLLNAAAESAEMSKERIASVVRFYSYLERRCQWLREINGPLLDSAGVKVPAIDSAEYQDRLYDAREALRQSDDALL